MKRFAKIILGALAALVIVFFVLLVGVNLYLQSGDVQQRIRLATEDALGMPVTVKHSLFFPWSGLTLSGLSLPDPTVPGANLVEAPTFSVKFRFWPLLARKLVISQVNLDSPHLVLRQTQDKQWVIVAPRTKIKPEVVSEKPAPEIPSSPSTKPSISLPSYKVELKYFSIRDGSADVYDRKGARIGKVAGLNLDGTFVTQDRIEGHVTIEDIELLGLFYPNRLRADFVHEGDMLAVTNLKFAIAEGKVRGEFSVVAPRKDPPAFQIKSEVEEVSLSALLSEAHLDGAGAAGTLHGDLDLRGNPLDTSTLEGGGAFALDSAQLRPFDIVQQLGMLLGIEELQLLKLNEASMRYQVRDEKVLLSDVRLRTENLIVTGKGPIKFNGKMNLDGHFLINEKIERRLAVVMSNQFVPSAIPGYKEVAFKVTGKTSRPETDLLDKVTGYHISNLGNFGGLLKDFFKAPKPAEPEPMETATP
ncbi:MAG: AsmA family protein [Chthoniobacterales bacterium]